MKIGIFEHGWWKAACDALGHQTTALPVASHPSGNAYAADLGSRVANGESVARILNTADVDVLLDNGGTGLGFARKGSAADDLQLAHEVASKRLCSHFVDPLSTAMQGLNWHAVWQSLQSQNWIKAIWDRAHAAELARFGVPNVMHLPMAAPDRRYDTSPLDARSCRPVVSFVGGQNTTFFRANTAIPAGALLPGTLAQAVRADSPDLTFYDMYYDLYGLGTPILPTDDANARAQKTLAYFSAKLFHHAALCIRNRDRFVIFLKRKLGDRFQLVGNGWDTAYGLTTQPPLPSTDAYFNHFRQVAINLNLVNGNAETGLNMRHFEITAAGGFMLCYHQPELADHFDIGKECVVFTNESDLLDKIQYYIDRPDERAAIALAGQHRTLSQHLYRHRLQTLLQTAMPRPLPVEYSTTTWREDFTRYVSEPDVILDCGANTGQTATGFRELYPKAEIYSFEPVRALFDQLSEKCRTLDVHPVCKAVGDHDGRSTINLTASHEANSLLGYQEGNPCAQWTRIIGQEQIDICTLDTWCEDSGIDPRRVDILKLDVQGAELKALYGARKLLTTTTIVYLEVCFVSIYKDCPLLDEIEAFMTECGYRRRAIYPSDQPYNWGDALYIKE